MQRAPKSKTKKTVSKNQGAPAPAAEIQRLRRQLTVEAALEKIRVHTLGWKNSDGLSGTSALLFRQLKKIGINTLRTSLGIFDEPNDAIELWLTTTSDQKDVVQVLEYVNLHVHPVFENQLKAKQSKEPYSLTTLRGKQVKEYYENMSMYLSLPRQSTYHDEEHFYSFFFSQGSISVIVEKPLTEEECAIMLRFASVFGLIYTRFLDLKKAEAQAQEARIEAALEKVRSRAMAMRSSTELQEVADVLREQMASLGQPELETAAVHLYEEDPDFIHSWRAFRLGTRATGGITKGFMAIPKDSCEVVREWMSFFHQGRKEYTIEVTGEKRDEWYNKVLFKIAPDLKKALWKSRHEPRYYHFSTFSGGALLMVAVSHPSEESAYLQLRAAGVFDLAYRRFLDLRNAEAQAREATIEAALERVRSRSMAMHHTSELQEVINTVHQQFKLLNIAATGGAFIAINEENDKELTIWGAGGLTDYAERVRFPFFNRPIYTGILAGMKKGPAFFTETFSREEKIEFFKHLFEHPPFSNAGPDRKKELLSRPGGYTRSCCVSKYTTVFIINHHGEQFSEEENRILSRFGSVFEQTYTRFLDLQKAEAQLRESQIEAALERVRASTMAMHKSEQLLETAQILFKQFGQFGKTPDRIGIGIMREEKGVVEWWVTHQKGTQTTHLFESSIQQPTIAKFFDSWKKGSDSIIVELEGTALKEWIKFVREDVKMPIDDSQMKGKRVHHAAFFTHGLLLISHHDLLPEETMQLLIRFAKVFGQTYTRFLDLKKAEAQAREAQVEASLERVRSSMMAMHQSEGLPEVMKIIADQLLHLGVQLDNVLFLPSQRGDDLSFWSGIPEKTYPLRVDVPYTENPLMTGLKDAMKERREFSTITLSRDESLQWWQNLFDRSTIGPVITAERKQYILGGKGMTCSIAGRKNSLLVIVNYNAQKFSEEANTLLMRFANVFEQAYTRFLDIQTAEAQAREAQVEASLERVRAKTMAMHNSEDVGATVATLFDELVKLGVETNRCGILIFGEGTDTEVWTAKSGADGQADLIIGHLDVTIHPLLQKVQEAWHSKQDAFQYELSGDNINAYYQAINNYPGYPTQFDLGKIPAQEFHSDFFFSEGAIFAFTSTSILVESAKILRRFASVFGQTYTRYLDLLKAEAQAREARIEASLERVRAKAMAMHSSKDLTDSIQVFYKELLSLGLQPRRVGVALTDRDSKMAKLTTLSTTEQGVTSIVEGNLRMEGHWLLDDAFTHWLQQKEFHAVLKGTEINNYYQVVRPQISYPDYPHDATQYGYYFMFPEGNVVAWTENPLAESELKIFRKFTSVISLTYKRHKDLVDAEERAQLAVREASLDRVRAEIASMRHADDLQRITPLMWRELKTLGVPFFRCGVLIINEEKRRLDYYLSTPEGHPLAALHLDFNTTIEVVQQALHHWQQQKEYINHWNREQFVAFARSMMEQGQIQTMKSYQGGDQPPESLTLQFIPFAQGMLYVGSADALSPDQLKLVHALADAFSTAYARYEDFTRLEAAKATVENTLSELRTTQTQLVQSEKMASLGELTAGIAHEIQNPLNFVNNFSEVSKELLEEMEEELKKGNSEDALQIAKDIIQNLEKINFHGKRADGIVKSMLQHSRKSTGQKELTDINALCDEYLRLSYHGLRAKDKSFNAKFETQLDPALPKINVVPQDIGRVVLNLINNAFYAVGEKQKAKSQKQGADYEPTVIVSTKSLGNKIEICVKDNGSGIPANIKEKIFQPFFTTKPTGQGTGLGLSISYDVVTKSHNGELRVETQEGEGSQFIIQLPT